MATKISAVDTLVPYPDSGDDGMMIYMVADMASINPTTADQTVSVKVYKRVGEEAAEDITSSLLTSVTSSSSGYLVRVSRTYSGAPEITTIGTKITVSAGNEDVASVKFVLYSVSGTTSTALQTIEIPVVRDGAQGAQGSRGAALRGPIDWEDVDSTFAFESGGEGDSFLDVVVYNGQYYYCTQNHVKGNVGSNPATLASKNTYWKVGDKFGLVATNILLATYSLIKNLGVETIEMKDANGNVVFSAKDGVVECNAGKFDSITVTNANVSGKLIADALYLKFGAGNESCDCSMYFEQSKLTLEVLPEKTARTIRVYNPVMSRATPEDLALIPANEDMVYINGKNSVREITAGGINSGKYYELLGYCSGDITYWEIREIASASEITFS
jgi:hypothetical protein